MKKNKIYISLFIMIMGWSSCDNNFLDRYPLDAITSPNYFKSPSDLETYVNRFYAGSFYEYPMYGADFDSDNQVGNGVDTRLEGSRVLKTSKAISFSAVRDINYFFDNYKRVEENYSLKDYQQYLGEAYFFKAVIYSGLLSSYGDIQWLIHTLNTDSPELYNARDKRNIVADNIISLLDSAAMYLTSDKTKGQGRVNKWMALLLQSRMALFEGTWEKYHANTAFGVAGAQPNKYLKKAAEAALEIMESGKYDIYSTGKSETDYKDLFALQDYSKNKEVMFWREYDNEVIRGDKNFRNERNFRMETPSNNSITKQLADAYLCSDGKPISVSPLYKGNNTLSDEMKNRDPRFYQTIATPDDVWKINSDGSVLYWKEVYNKMNSSADYNSPAGYINMKGYNPNMIYHVQQFEESPSIVYRYAEILLNYAEAKAELETLTQQDLDKSINKLRKRVGMPDMKLSGITTDTKWNFPSLSPIINEIRRERRVELACEGYRWTDIARWAAADELIIGTRPKGFKASQIKENPFPVDEKGFLDPFQKALPQGYQFKINRDYLNPIPEIEIVINPNLTQNPGWH